MANEEQLEILHQGVEVWNQWRKSNPESKPDLSDANLSKANLSNADLCEANLSNADLCEANLSGTKLIYAGLVNANLYRANLSGADISGANLSGANLSKANLNKANLTAASLSVVRLINTKLDGTNLTETQLWETQRLGWSIKGVICEYAYWDEDAKEKTEYAPGEFERLFAEQPKIRLSYKDGISLAEVATLPALIQHLEEKQGCTLRFVSIQEASGGAVVELAIEDTAEKSSEELQAIKLAIAESARRDIEILRQILTGKNVEINVLNGKVEGLKDAITHILKATRGETIMGDKYEISGQAGAVGPNAHAHDMTMNHTVNNAGEALNLVALAAELTQLRLAIATIAAKPDSSPQAAIALGRVAEAEIAASDKNTPKVLEHLKSAGKWTLGFAKEIDKDVVAEAIKQSMGIT